MWGITKATSSEKSFKYVTLNRRCTRALTCVRMSVKAVMKRLLLLPKDADLCKFLLLKDPNQPRVNVYKVPADSFDFEEEEEQTGEVQDDEDDSDE
jgi:hypothetical protein